MNLNRAFSLIRRKISVVAMGPRMFCLQGTGGRLGVLPWHAVVGSILWWGWWRSASWVAPRTGSKSAKLDPFAGKGSPYYKGKGQLPEGGGKYHVGKPYQVAGRWYTPKEQPSYDKTGMASWYGEAFHARKTSNGEWFDMNDLTAAHPTLPLPSYAKVTNLANGREVVVRINDRGPFVGTRLIDLSKRTPTRSASAEGQDPRSVCNGSAMPRSHDKGYRHLAMMNAEMKEGSSIRQLAAAARGKAPATHGRLRQTSGRNHGQEDPQRSQPWPTRLRPNRAHGGRNVRDRGLRGPCSNLRQP
jgi:hypothetical protein